jgi:hypothetical protein
LFLLDLDASVCAAEVLEETFRHKGRARPILTPLVMAGPDHAKRILCRWAWIGSRTRALPSE